MIRPRSLIVLLALAATARASSPYDTLHTAYAPYIHQQDPLAWPIKVRALSRDPYRFWRGSKDLFFNWAKTNCSDWLADRDLYVPTHGDLHFGNIGSYAAAGELGTLSIGLVDFDDSALLPLPLELLSGVITLRLTAITNSIAIDESQAAVLLDDLLQSYGRAVESTLRSESLLSDAPIFTKLLSARGEPYMQQIESMTLEGKFRPIIRSKSGKVKEILRPLSDRKTSVARSLAASIAKDPSLAERWMIRDAAAIEASIHDIALRTRVDSAGSQGLEKILVLMRSPMRGVEGEVILYLKQEIPSAAERSGVAALDTRTPGERTRDDMRSLTRPQPFLNAAIELDGKSYWLSLKEPWSAELDSEQAKTFDDLRTLARGWGTVAAAAHREAASRDALRAFLTPTLRSQLLDRSLRYSQQLEREFDSFRSDPRVETIIDQANETLKQFQAQ